MVYAQVSLLSASSKPWHMGVWKWGRRPKYPSHFNGTTCVWQMGPASSPRPNFQSNPYPNNRNNHPPSDINMAHSSDRMESIIIKAKRASLGSTARHLKHETVQFQWFPISPGKILKNIVKYDMIWHGEIWLNILSKISLNQIRMVLVTLKRVATLDVSVHLAIVMFYIGN